MLYSVHLVVQAAKALEKLLMFWAGNIQKKLNDTEAKGRINTCWPIAFMGRGCPHSFPFITDVWR